MKKYRPLLFSALVASLFLTTGCGNTSEENKTTEQKKDTLSTEKTAENLSPKAKCLTDYIGTHPLVHVSGFVGANTMMDYWIEDGVWKANGSSNEGGMREGYDLEVDQTDLSILQSMKIVVNKDLSVDLFANDEKIFSAVYFDDKFQHELKPEAKYITMPEDLQDENSKPEGAYYLYAKDDLTEDICKKMDLLEIGADVVILKVYEDKPQFEMMFFVGECCDNSIYTFGKE